MRTVAFCEIDPFCRRVLAKHWPGVPIHDDVRSIPRIGCDIITGGYPCQPFSHAGVRKGAADDRHLWPAMRSVIERERPTWVLAENVTGHITMGLDKVLADLEADGYAGRAIVVPAAAADAWHIRERIWIMARNTDSGRQSVGAVDDEAQGMPSTVAYAYLAGLERRVRRELQERGAERAAGAGGASANTPRSQCGKWLPEPPVGRVANGIPRRMDRLRALGNAVVPQVVEMIGRAIMKEAA